MTERSGAAKSGRKIFSKYGEANLGKKQSLETINKRLKKLLGKIRTEEQKTHYRLAGVGKWMLGRKRSVETRMKMS